MGLSSRMSSAYGTTDFGRSDRRPVVGGVYAGNTRGGSCVGVARPAEYVRDNTDVMLFVADMASLCFGTVGFASCVFVLTELIDTLCRD